MSMTGEFRQFAVKGNVIDLAVGVIIGGAFGKIVDSLVADIIMPVVGAIFGNLDFSNLFIVMGKNPGNLATLAELKSRVWDDDHADVAMRGAYGESSPASVDGAVPPYAFASYAIDHHPAKIGVPTGDWRGRAHGLTAFFTECFIDELAAVSGVDPFSVRMAALGNNPRLAQCLSRVAARGGWQGGGVGTGQGLACHSMADSHIAVFAEADLGGTGGRVRVSRLVAVVDCGRVINPDIVKQQIAGGLMFGMAAATGAPVNVIRGLAGPVRMGELGLPRLADAPRIEIELLNSPAPPGGVGELAVPPVAPAIANALYAGSGKRYRTLPLVLR